MVRSYSRLGAVFGFAALVWAVPVALADFSPDISDIVYKITASNSDGTGSMAVGLERGRWYYDLEKDAVGFEWTLDAPVDITAANGAVIAKLLAGSFLVDCDPQINLSFAVQAGSATTSFTISSALLSFPTIPIAQGLASAAYSVTDINYNSATLTGLGPNGMSYLAHYNGEVPAGTSFTEQIPQVLAPAGGTGTDAVTIPPVGYLPIGDPVSDMSSEVTFTLTAHDLASGTSNYEIAPVPEPAGLLLAVVGLMLARRRA